MALLTIYHQQNFLLLIFFPLVQLKTLSYNRPWEAQVHVKKLRLALETLCFAFNVIGEAHGRIGGKLKGRPKGVITARGPDRLEELSQNR